MVAGGPARIATQPVDSSAALRMGRLDALKSRMGRTGRAGMAGLSLLSAAQAAPIRNEADPIRRDPVSELRTDRMAMQKYANPQFSTPSFQVMTNNLREEGDAEDIANAEALDQDMFDIADQGNQADDLSLLSRVRSQWQAKKEEGAQKLIEKGKKDLQKTIQKAKTEGAAKFASGVDEGNFFEVVDTIGTGVSVANVGLSIFHDSMDPMLQYGLSQQGLGELSPTKAEDYLITAGTGMQVGKWSFVVVVLLPFFATFLLLSIGNACKSNVACKNMGPGILGLVQQIGAL